jgi:hypothetical protein
MEEKGSGGYRSLFWPLVLIGAGVVGLLATTGVLSRANFVVLVRLWPVLLILVGLDVLFGRRSPVLGALLGIAAVALVIGLMLVGPSLGWDDDLEVKTDRFSEPLGAATSASVRLNLSSGPAEITALSDSGDLIDAELNYTGEIDFEVSGDRDKTVTLGERDADTFFFFDWFSGDDDELRWEVGLSPQVPLDLDVDGGSGSVELDLRALQLAGLILDVGSGSVDGRLPATEARYDARVDGGSGSCRLNVAGGADVGLEIDVGSGSIDVTIGSDVDLSVRVEGGSGSLAIDVPEDAAVRLDVREGGSGNVRVPAGLERTRSGDDDEGTWETPGYASADHKIEIVVVDLGSGDVRVR